MGATRSIRQMLYRQECDYDALPAGSAEDVEFSKELADEDDREAQQRAREADRRAVSCEED